MDSTRQTASYLISAIIATSTISSCTTKSPTPYETNQNAHIETASPQRNEFVFNFFKTIARTAVAPFAVTYSGMTNLYDQVKEHGPSKLLNIGGVMGPIKPKTLEEVTARMRQEDMNSPVGDKGDFYREIEKYPIFKTLVDEVPMATILGPVYSPLFIPAKHVLSEAFNKNPNIRPTNINTKISQYKTYQRNQLH